MDWIIGLTVAGLSLAIFLYLHFTQSPLSERFRARWPTITQKVVMALLLGFCAFASVSAEISRPIQKITLILISASLIWAMSIHFESREKE